MFIRMIHGRVFMIVSPVLLCTLTLDHHACLSTDVQHLHEFPFGTGDVGRDRLEYLKDFRAALEFCGLAWGDAGNAGKLK